MTSGPSWFETAQARLLTMRDENSRSLRLLPDHPHRITAVPSFGDRTDTPEKPALAAADVGDLDHRSGMTFGFEIGEAPVRSADLSLVADDKT